MRAFCQKQLTRVLANEVKNGILAVGHQIHSKLLSIFSFKNNVIVEKKFVVGGPRKP